MRVGIRVEGFSLVLEFFNVLKGFEFFYFWRKESIYISLFDMVGY